MDTGFQENILKCIESAAGGAFLRKARVVNLAEVDIMDPDTGKHTVIKLTIVAEPQIFGETIYCTDTELEVVNSGDDMPGVLRTSSVIDQLKHFENVQ